MTIIQIGSRTIAVTKSMSRVISNLYKKKMMIKKYSGIDLNSHSVRTPKCPRRYICWIEKIFQRSAIFSMQGRYRKVLREVGQGLEEFHIFRHSLGKRGNRATPSIPFKGKVRKAFNKNLVRKRIEKALGKFWHRDSRTYSSTVIKR